MGYTGSRVRMVVAGWDRRIRDAMAEREGKRPEEKTERCVLIRLEGGSDLNRGDMLRYKEDLERQLRTQLHTNIEEVPRSIADPFRSNPRIQFVAVTVPYANSAKVQSFLNQFGS